MRVFPGPLSGLIALWVQLWIFGAKAEKSSLYLRGLAGSNICGLSWDDASAKCSAPCPKGLKSECPTGEKCFANVSCAGKSSSSQTSSSSTEGEGVAIEAGITYEGNVCGLSWTDASIKCETACPEGLKSECPGEQKCFSGVSCGGEPSVEDPPYTSQSASSLIEAGTAFFGNVCGLSWDDAATKCTTSCPTGSDSECPSGETCFASVACGDGASTTNSTVEAPTDAVLGPPIEDSGNYIGNVCGASWTDATTRCSTACPNGSTGEFPEGELCYGSISCGILSPTASPTTVPRASKTGPVIDAGSLYVGSVCGWSWDDAAAKCSIGCPFGSDSECPIGESCFADVTCGAGSPTIAPTPAPAPEIQLGPSIENASAYVGNVCGSSWDHASSHCSTACPNGLKSECPMSLKCFANVTCGAAEEELPSGGVSGNMSSGPDNYCGSTFKEAETKCSVVCPNGLDSECPSGEQCFASVKCKV